MLGYLLGVMLVLTAFSPFIFTEIFADSFSADFDKQQYKTGDSLTLSGEILELAMPVIAMSVYDPDGKILSANNLEISPHRTFSKSISLDSPFYEKVGEYTVKLAYGQISQEYPFIIEGDSSEPEIIEEPKAPEITLLYTEKKQYTDKEIIKIMGAVSLLDSPTALIGIYDPFGMPAGFYFGTVDNDLEFSTSFPVKAGVNFKVDGTYSIKAHYAETSMTTFFDFYENLQPIIKEDPEEETEPSNEIIPELDALPDKKTDNNQETDNHQETDTYSDTEIPVVDTSQTHESISYNNSILQNDKNISVNIKNSEVKATKIINENNPKKIVTNTEIKKQKNLTVEDIELGKLLNQINLKCDSSTFTDTISYYDGMGPALYRLCKFDSSLNFFNESLVENPNDVEILVNKGSALGKLGYFSEAITYYDQAIKIDPTFLPAKNNKANTLANLGNYDGAILLYNEILEKNPNYNTAKNNLEIVLSINPQIHHVIDKSVSSSMENIVTLESPIPETIDLKPEEQKTENFFEDLGMAFLSLGSFFGFSN